jgi:methionyl-tRNA formyltransferase
MGKLTGQKIPSTWKGRSGRLKDIRIKIHKGRKIEKEAPPGSSAGEISGINKEGIEVCCGYGSTFLIESLQPENRRRMEAYAFSLGAEIKIGDRFA